MSSFKAVLDFLDQQAVPHQVIPVTDSSAIDRSRWVRPVLFRDLDGFALVISPLDEFLDIEALRGATGRELRPVFTEIRADFLNNHGGADLFPLGAIYKVPTFIQRDIPRDGPLGIVDGDNINRIEMDAGNFWQLQFEPTDIAFTTPVTAALIEERIQRHAFSRKRIEAMLGDVEGLPAMPEMSTRILQVTGDPDSDATDLARVIEVDPSLSAQIISYATSAFYGYRGEISSVRDAISRVLGFDLVANIALGIAIGTGFRVTADGPIGLSAFWRHAVYTSALAERISKAVPRDRGVKSGMAYLSGLLHDFGFLLLGHLMPDVFKALNQAIAANPTIEVTTLEDLVVGFRHTDMGDQLLQQWKIHDEAVLAARHHHNPDYRDEMAAYAHLTLVAEHLLHEHGVVSDSSFGPVPESTLALLGLTEQAIAKAARPVLEACAGLDTLAQMLGQKS